MFVRDSLRSGRQEGWKGILPFLCETRAFPPSCTWLSYAIFLELQKWKAEWVESTQCPEPDGFPAWKHRMD